MKSILCVLLVDSILVFGIFFCHVLFQDNVHLTHWIKMAHYKYMVMNFSHREDWKSCKQTPDKRITFCNGKVDYRHVCIFNFIYK